MRASHFPTKRYITRPPIGRIPVNEMSAITEWLKERGLDLKTIEIMDISLKGTRQTKIHEWGVAPRNYQIRLTDFGKNRV